MRRFMTGLSLVLLMAIPALAEVRHLTIKVDGISCSLCAFGLKKTIGSMVEEGGTVEVTLKTGKLSVRPKPGSPLDYRRIWEGVKTAGFTPRWAEMTAVGTFDSWKGPDGKSYLSFNVTGNVTGSEQRFVLENDSPQVKKLRKISNYQEKSFRITGRLHDHPPGARDQEGRTEGFPPGLDLKEFQEEARSRSAG